MSGTDSQVLWHARHLRDLGHSVRIIGLTREDVEEEGIKFIGTTDRDTHESCLRDGRVGQPDVLFIEGPSDAAPLYRGIFSNLRIAHIGHNIDRQHPDAFQYWDCTDSYVFVGPGQYASYCASDPQKRHKFFLVRNCIPWHHIYADFPREKATDQILWVGNWQKKGLRMWAEVMERVLKNHPNYRWLLCGPQYPGQRMELPPYILQGLQFDSARIDVKSLPLLELAKEIQRSRVVIVSVGNECSPISTLDAHALGRPVISGNDMIYKYANPEGTGLRVRKFQEAIYALEHLISNPYLCDELGENGRQFVSADRTEEHQKSDLSRLIRYLALRKDMANLDEHSAPTTLFAHYDNIRDKIKRKLLTALSRI